MMKQKSGTLHPGHSLHSFAQRYFPPKYLRRLRKRSIGGITGGNRVRLITDGDICFTEFRRAIRAATETINLETYIFNSDRVGHMIADELIRARGRGVRVNVIYDAIGSINTDRSLFASMRRAGIHVIDYHPIIPWRRYFNISLRDHRKILVVDGRVAFIGGINIGKEYAGRKFGGDNWRDTHVKIEGPAVSEIQFFFMTNWVRNGGAPGRKSDYFPEPAEHDDKLVIILSSKSRKNVRTIRNSYLSAINTARESILIANAYFIPDRRFYSALIRAARRGVKVILLLPGKTDVPMAKWAGMYLYRKYLRSGIRVFEYEASVLHTKTAVIDGIWSTVGSSNLDRRSMRHNLELNAVILDQEFGEQMERVFFKDLKSAREITLHAHERRSIATFFREWFWYRFRNFL